MSKMSSFFGSSASTLTGGTVPESDELIVLVVTVVIVVVVSVITVVVSGSLTVSAAEALVWLKKSVYL